MLHKPAQDLTNAPALACSGPRPCDGLPRRLPLVISSFSNSVATNGYAHATLGAAGVRAAGCSGVSHGQQPSDQPSVYRHENWEKRFIDASLSPQLRSSQQSAIEMQSQVVQYRPLHTFLPIISPMRLTPPSFHVQERLLVCLSTLVGLAGTAFPLHKMHTINGPWAWV